MATAESIDQLDSFRDNYEFVSAAAALGDDAGSENMGGKPSISSVDVRRRIEMLREDRELRYRIDDVFCGDFNE